MFDGEHFNIGILSDFLGVLDRPSTLSQEAEQGRMVLARNLRQCLGAPFAIRGTTDVYLTVACSRCAKRRIYASHIHD